MRVPIVIMVLFGFSALIILFTLSQRAHSVAIN
jgi:hypothetical protein